MCGPLALPIAAAELAAGGALMQGVQGLQQGNYAAAVAKQNAGLEIESARSSLDMAQNETKQFYRKVGAVKGEQIASMAANGIDVGSGTALTIQQDTQAGADDDAATLYKNQYERTRGHVINANNYVAEASAAKARGQSAMINSVFSAASSAMGAFGQMKGLQAKMGGDSGWGPSMATSTFNPGSGRGFN